MTLDQDIQDFLDNGGEIKQLPQGASAYDKPPRVYQCQCGATENMVYGKNICKPCQAASKRKLKANMRAKQQEKTA